MDLQSDPLPAPMAAKIDPRQAAQSLGALLRQAPEYEAFLKALKAVNGDQAVQSLGTQIRTHQSAVKWGRDDNGQHAAEMARLESEIENLPTVKEYRLAEAEVQKLFRAVDEIISQAAGVAFAVNARRSGCCG